MKENASQWTQLQAVNAHGCTFFLEGEMAKYEKYDSWFVASGLTGCLGMYKDHDWKVGKTVNSMYNNGLSYLFFYEVGYLMSIALSKWAKDTCVPFKCSSKGKEEF